MPNTRQRLHNIQVYATEHNNVQRLSNLYWISRYTF